MRSSSPGGVLAVSVGLIAPPNHTFRHLAGTAGTRRRQISRPMARNAQTWSPPFSRLLALLPTAGDWTAGAGLRRPGALRAALSLGGTLAGAPDRTPRQLSSGRFGCPVEARWEAVSLGSHCPASSQCLNAACGVADAIGCAEPLTHCPLTRGIAPARKRGQTSNPGRDQIRRHSFAGWRNHWRNPGSPVMSDEARPRPQEAH
jgi:hypothetical protein